LLFGFLPRAGKVSHFSFALSPFAAHVGVSHGETQRGFACFKLCSKETPMTPYNRRLNPYIRRMAEDMQVRNLAPATIDAYTFHVDKFCQFFGKSADQLGPEEIRQYQLYLVNEKKASWSSFNQAVCGLRFLYEVTLGKPWTVRHIPFGKRPKKLPTVLSDQEVSCLLECVKNPKHRAVLLTCYAAGLRLSEATHLRIPDIDGQRMQIRITNAKGSKERLVPASPRLLEELREYWKLRRPGNYLFPGMTADVPLSGTSVQKACKPAAAKAGITKNVTPHILRHSYATGMLEAGVDLLTISKLLGHSSFVTTMIYLHVRRQHFDRSPSPIDWLPLRQCPQWAERPEPPATPGTVTPAPTPSTAENTMEQEPHQPPPARPQRRTSGRQTPQRRRGRE
jgi:site-specific recombinase XerD